MDQVAANLLTEPAGSRWYVLFPVRFGGGKAAELRDRLFELRGKGFNRLFQNGRTFEFSSPESLLEIDFAQPLFALVDRIVLAPDLHQRIVDSIEICYRESGEVVFEQAGAETRACCGSAKSSPARPIISSPSIRSRACSASIAFSARVRDARVSAIRSTTTPA